MKKLAFFICFVVGFPVFSVLAVEPICPTCNNTGKAKLKCEACNGTKYVWTCVPKTSTTRSYFGSVTRSTTGKQEGYCGYGATYKPRHEKCQNSRKRANCPECCNKVGSASTGYVIKECPDCDGAGHAVRTYYVIRDGSVRLEDKWYVFDDNMKTDSRHQTGNILAKRWTDAELADYQSEHAKCEVFEQLEDMKHFLKTGERKEGKAPRNANQWYFIVRDTTNITQENVRQALEEVDRDTGYRARDYGWSHSNILKRRYSPSEADDFKVGNPNSKIFKTFEEFRAFIREAHVRPEPSPATRPPVGRVR